MNFGIGGENHSPSFFHQEDPLAGIAAGAFFKFSPFLSMGFCQFIWGVFFPFFPLFLSPS